MAEDTDDLNPRDEWLSRRGFKWAKLYPVDWESAIAELYHGDDVWACVSLAGIDQDAEGEDRVRNARFVVQFWGEPDKPTGEWRFNLDLDGALEQLKEVRAWLWENETGRVPTAGPGLTAAGQAVERMSIETQAEWEVRRKSSSEDAGS